MESLSLPSRRHSKMRLGFFSLCRFICVVLGGRRWYRWRYLNAKRIVLRHEELRVPRLPKDLEGLTLLQLSDLHAGPFLKEGDLGGLRDKLAGLQPDVLLLTGDYITDDWRDVEEIATELGALGGRLGAFAIFGNHDYRGHQEGRIRQALADQGIVCLQDEGRRLEGLPLWISGLNDLEEIPEPNAQAARAGMGEQDYEIMLCHNPGGAPKLVSSRCIAILSGHTHGRQIDLPFVRRLGPAHPGLRMRLGPTTLIVNRGLGTVGVPIRVGAPAEAVWIELRAELGVTGSGG